MELLRRASLRLSRPAIVHQGKTVSYGELASAAERLSGKMSVELAGRQQPRIGLHAAPGPEYAIATLAIWQCGGIAVPLATSHPASELSYVLQDAGVTMVLSREDGLHHIADVAHQHSATVQVVEAPSGSSSSSSSSGRGDSDVSWSMGSGAESGGLVRGVGGDSQAAAAGALIIYTSGTTGKPKGVLHTHRSLEAQVAGLVDAWQWQASDSLLHALPLHHIHGIVNALYCPLYAGACTHMLNRFSPAAVWSRIMDGSVSVMMGVPTMYSLLLSAYDAMAPEQQSRAAAAASRLRLTVCGSSACPVPLMQRWKALSGQHLLERYGMTEVGMALSNPYQGERRPGSVGQPLPGVSVRIAEDGELLVRGATVFKEYWGRAEATAQAFTPDGFFKTGDTAGVEWVAAPSLSCLAPAHQNQHPDQGLGSTQAQAQSQTQTQTQTQAQSQTQNHGEAGPGAGVPYYTILGRTSVDIIKSAGYKLSALQLEGALLEHPQLAEVAVLGVPDQVYGEVVTALVVPRATETQAAVDPQQFVAALKSHASTRLAPYQLPRKYIVMAALPRNAMGKVNKKEMLKNLLATEAAAAS
ncbi:hypothetical protein V8C86DRAFT_2678839 [Haematococcus lacustris]